MSTCSFGHFWPDGGQKMAWLQVSSGTLSLRPYSHVSFSFFLKTKIFFSAFKTISVHRVFFFSVTESGTIFDGDNGFVFTGIQYHDIHSTAKQCFLKYPLWKAFREDEL